MGKIANLLNNKKIVTRGIIAAMFFFGVIVSVMIPPWQTPDEVAHLTVIGEGFKNENLAREILSDINLGNDRIRFNYDEKLNVEDWKESISSPAKYNRSECLPNGISFSIVKHLPSSLGIMLGVVLKLPAFWVLELGELFALVFYVFACALAIKIMPIKKEVLMMFMAFPMTIQQAASISYDAVVLPLGFIFIAYIFYLRFRENNIKFKEIIALFAIIILIAYIKPPYIFLALLLLLLPKEKFYLKIKRLVIDGDFIKRWRILASILFLGLIILAIYFLRENFWINLVYSAAAEFLRTGHLFLNTFIVWGKYLSVSSVGQFGWLESSVPFIFVVFTYLIIIFLSITSNVNDKSEKALLSTKSRIFLVFVFFVLASFVMLSMINHTVTVTLFGRETNDIIYNIREALHQIPYIGGLQGRYFLPLLPLPFLALPEIKCKIKNKEWIVLAYIILACIITINVLIFRYWKG